MRACKITILWRYIMMSAYDLFECFEFFYLWKDFPQTMIRAKKETGYPPKSHLCYPKIKACIDMKNNNMQRKVICPRIFYLGLESNPLTKSPAESPLWEPVFLTPVLVGGDSSCFLFWKEKCLFWKGILKIIRVACLFY